MFGIGNSNDLSPAPAPRERFHIVRAARIVLATGAIEQPLIFANNDRPGIMLAGAARQYYVDTKPSFRALRRTRLSILPVFLAQRRRAWRQSVQPLCPDPRHWPIQTT